MRNSKARAIALHTHTYTPTHQNKDTHREHNSHVPLPIAHDNLIIIIIVCQLPHSLRVKGCSTLFISLCSLIVIAHLRYQNLVWIELFIVDVAKVCIICVCMCSQKHMSLFSVS
jgi:magnesium-transporting ATPase (P-type)